MKPSMNLIECLTPKRLNCFLPVNGWMKEGTFLSPALQEQVMELLKGLTYSVRPFIVEFSHFDDV